MYEEELRKKRKNWKDAITKEAKRRRNAESEVKRLKAKIEELEFLLDERENSSVSSSDDEGVVSPFASLPPLPTLPEATVEVGESSDAESGTEGDSSPKSSELNTSTPATPDKDAAATEEIRHILVHARPVPKSRRLSGGASKKRDVKPESPFATTSTSEAKEAPGTEESVSPSRSKDTFESRIKKRLEDREQVMEEREKRLVLVEEWERSAHRAHLDEVISPRGEKPALDIGAIAGENATAGVPKSEKEEKNNEKKSILDRISDVFKPGS